MLYPLFTIGLETDIAHAHNMLLQVAVDLGLLGLIAYLALLVVAALSAWRAARGSDLLVRATALGVLAGLVALHIYGLTDALAPGSKPALAFWLALGLLAVLPQDDAAWACGLAPATVAAPPTLIALLVQPSALPTPARPMPTSLPVVSATYTYSGTLPTPPPDAVWSATGKYVAAVGCDDAGCAIYSANGNGSHKRRLASLDTSDYPLSLSWAADEQSVTLILASGSSVSFQTAAP